MKLNRNWIVNILFLFFLLKTEYRLFAPKEGHSIFWSVFYFSTEYFLSACLFFKLYIAELSKKIRLIYLTFFGFFALSLTYEIIIGLTVKNYEQYQNRYNSDFFSIIDITLMLFIFIMILFDIEDA